MLDNFLRHEAANGAKLGSMFERFTDRARLVLVLAQEEARLLDHGFIGTEHILLGLVREGEGLAARALEVLGISLEAVREKVNEKVGHGDSTNVSSPPFTPRAKKVLELSLRESRKLRHDYIGPEHLLLGLAREGEGVAAQVLEELGASLSRVRQQVISLLGSPPILREDDLFPETAEVARQRGFAIPKALHQRSYAVGRHLMAEVIVAGRNPEDFAVAYNRLVELARGLGLDDPGAGRLDLYAVQTNRGPGVRLTITIVPGIPSEDGEEQGG